MSEHILNDRTQRQAACLRIALAALAISPLAGCGAADRLANVGKAPALSAIEDPTASPATSRCRCRCPTPSR